MCNKNIKLNLFHIKNTRNILFKRNKTDTQRKFFLIFQEDDISVDSVGFSKTDLSGEIDEEFRTGRSSFPHFHNQELDDLIRDLGLTKSVAEFLTSRMQEFHSLDEECRRTV